MRSYRAALRQIKKNQVAGAIPSLDNYVLVLKATSGFDMVFNMLILVEGCAPPEVIPDLQFKLDSLTATVADIIAWSLVSFSTNFPTAARR